MSDLPKYAKYPGACVFLFGHMQAAARLHGYALAIHGSLNRDIDLIAVPWIELPGSAEEVAHEIAKSIGAHIPSYITVPGVEGHVANPIRKPHGRESWVIPLSGGVYVDLSVIAPRPPELFSKALGTE
jgi:hypothetical protein